MAEQLSNETLIERRFDEFNTDGWWHQDNGETYSELYRTMVVAGIAPDTALKWLEMAYAAAADEYGA